MLRVPIQIKLYFTKKSGGIYDFQFKLILEDPFKTSSGRMKIICAIVSFSFGAIFFSRNTQIIFYSIIHGIFALFRTSDVFFLLIYSLSCDYKVLAFLLIEDLETCTFLWI